MENFQGFAPVVFDKSIGVTRSIQFPTVAFPTQGTSIAQFN